MMRRTPAVLASAALAVSLGASAQPAPAPEAGRPLSLEAAAARALAKNHEIAIEYEAVRVGAAGVSRAAAAYEPTIGVDVRYRDHTDPINSVFSGAPEGKDAPNVSGVSAQATFGQLLPTGARVSFGAGVSRDRTDNQFAILSPAYSTSLGLEVRQPLFQNLRIDPARRAIRIAAIDRTRSLAALKRTVSETVAAVERAYWNVVAARREADIRRKNVSLALEQRTDTQAKIEAGTLPETDLAQPNAEVERRRGELLAAEENLSRAELALKTILLDDPNDPLWGERLLPTDAPETARPPADLAALLADAESRRPELAEAQELVKRQEVDVVFAKDRVRPEVDVVAAYARRGLAGRQNPDAVGFGGLPPSAPEPLMGGLGRSYGTITETRFPDASIGLAVTIPVGNGAAKADVVAAESGVRQAQLALSRARQQVAVEVRNAYTNVQTAAQRIEAARAGRAAAETQLSAERERFGVGLSTNFFVLTRQNELSQAEVTETAALTDYQKALTELLRATGTLLDARDVKVAEER
jgi:outer membrane protein TolC